MEYKKIPILIVLAIMISIIGLQNAHALINDSMVAYYSFDVDGTDSANNYKLSPVGGATIGLPGRLNNSFNNSNGTNLRYFYNGSVTNAKWWSGSVNNTQCMFFNATSYNNAILYNIGTNGVRQMIAPSFGDNQSITYIMNGDNPVISLSKQLSTNKWYYICFTYNANTKNISVYVDANLTGSTIAPNPQSFTSSLIYIGSGNLLGSGFPGQIDEFRVWNRIINDTEMQFLANSGAVVSNPLISFVGRSLSDITNTNLFDNPLVNYTYQYNNSVSNVWANYSITSSILSCVQNYNGTCMKVNNTWSQRLSFLNNTGTDFANYTFNFSENDIYPYTQNTNATLIGLGIHTDVISGTNNYYADELLNITAGQYNFYEAPILSNGTVNIYYYNGTYDFSSNPVTNNNVHLLCTYPNLTNYNHTHTIGSNTFGHNICSFFVNSTGYVGSVKYNGGGFLTRGNTQGVNIVMTDSTARTNAIRSTNNGGFTWSSVTGTIISHLHMFGSSDTFSVQAVGNYSGTLNTSSILTDNLDISPFVPEPPSVQIPNGSGTFGKFINITWEFAIPTTPNSYIKNYTVSLLNADSSFNATLNQTGNTSNSYLWNTYNSNLSTTLNYLLRITATDNNSLSSNSFSELINFSTNAEINISAKLFNGTVISNFSIYYTGNNTGICTTNNTYCLIDIIKNTNSNYLFNITGYSYSNISIINTNITSYYQFIIYTTNSVNFTAYDSTTNVMLSSTNVNVQLVGTYQQYNFSITTGTKYVDLLAPDTYNALFSSNGYYTKNYIITVSPNQYQYLNAYLLNNTNTNNKLINFLITDTSALPLEGVLVQVQRLLNNTYSTVESRYTDISGQVQFSLDTTLFYRVTESKNGYITKVYQIQPISTSYTDRMSDTNTITNTNLFSNITYYTLPLNSTIYPIPAVQNFQFITAGNGIVSFGISDGNNSQNISTGSGGTAQINYIPTNNNTKTVRIYYYINTINNGNYTFSQDYTFSNVAENSNYTISTGSFNPSFSKDGKIIIGAIMTVIVLIGFGAFMSGVVLTVVTIGLIILMVALGFYPMWIGVAFGVLLSLTLYIKER